TSWPGPPTAPGCPAAWPWTSAGTGILRAGRTGGAAAPASSEEEPLDDDERATRGSANDRGGPRRGLPGALRPAGTRGHRTHRAANARARRAGGRGRDP